jgi:hypothetical protein
MNVRERILQFTTQPVPHETKELGTIYLRRLTLGELDTIQKGDAASKDIPTTVRLMARFMGDEQGKPLFDLANKDDRDLLLAVPVALAADILRAGNRLNNMEEPKAGEAPNA